MSPSSRRPAPALAITVLLLAAGTVLRFLHLDLHDAWADEGITWAVAQSAHPIDLLTEHMNGEPPLYHVMVRPIAGPGVSLEALRATSAVFGMLAAALFAWVAWRWAGPRAGAAATAMYALSAFQVYYSQEARTYTLTALLGLVVLAVHLELLRRERMPAWAWGGLAVVEALLILSHYLAAFFMLGLATAVLLVPSLRRHWRGWLLAQGVGALLTSPWAATMASCYRRIHGMRILTDFRAVRDFPAPFLLFAMGRSLIPQQGSRWYWMEWGAVGAGAGLVSLWFVGGAWALARRGDASRFLVLACAAVVPVALMTAFSLFLFPCFSVVYVKYAIWAHAPMLLCAASWMEAELHRGRVWTIACALALFLAVNCVCLCNYFISVDYRKAPACRDAVAALGRIAGPGDEVLYARVQEGQAMDPLLARDPLLQRTRRGLLVDVGPAGPRGRFGSSCFLEWNTTQPRLCSGERVWIVLFRDWRARREEGMEQLSRRVYRQAHALADTGRFAVSDAVEVRGLEVIRLERR